MKIKKEYIILFLIIVVLVLYITLRKDNRIQYEIPEVTEINPEDISEIIIKGNDREVVLKKENDQWFVGADKYAADSYKIKNMINFLEKPILMSLVSDSKDYMRYGLDDKNRIIVQALSKESPERVVEIGNQADVRNYTFIKLGNDTRVYHAKEDLRDIFSTDIDDIRDKTVLSFNIDKVASVYLSRDGKDLAINKKAVAPEGDENKGTTCQWETDGGKIVEASLINALLDDMLKIKCSKYIYDTKEEPDNPLYVIRVKDENEHVLTVFPEKEDDYRAVSSDNPTPFGLYSWRIDNIIEKFDKISGEEKKKEAGTD